MAALALPKKHQFSFDKDLMSGTKYLVDGKESSLNLQ
jgi:hypothetical protein